ALTVAARGGCARVDVGRALMGTFHIGAARPTANVGSGSPRPALVRQRCDLRITPDNTPCARCVLRSHGVAQVPVRGSDELRNAQCVIGRPGLSRAHAACDVSLRRACLRRCSATVPIFDCSDLRCRVIAATNFFGEYTTHVQLSATYLTQGSMKRKQASE